MKIHPGTYRSPIADQSARIRDLIAQRAERNARIRELIGQLDEARRRCEQLDGQLAAARYDLAEAQAKVSSMYRAIERMKVRRTRVETRQ